MATTKKKTTKKPSASSTWANRASIEALLKFGPQETALQSLYDDARSTYAQQRDASRFFLAQQQRALTTAQGAVDQSYQTAQGRQGQIDAVIRGDLTKLGTGPAAQPAAAAALGSMGVDATNANNENKAFKDRLTQEGVDAVKGGQYQELQAQGQLAATVNKILQQRQTLGVEKGAFQDLTFDDLQQAQAKETRTAREKQRDRDAARGNALIGKGLDPSGNGSPLAGLPKSASKNHGKLSLTGKTLLSPDKHNEVRALVSSTLSSIPNRAAVKKITISQLASQLEAGSPSVSVDQPVWTTDKKGKRVQAKDDKGNLKVKTVTTSGKSGIKDGLLARATAEQIKNGHISVPTMKKLADSGYSISRLGFTTPRQYGNAVRASAKKKAANRPKPQSGQYLLPLGR